MTSLDLVEMIVSPNLRGGHTHLCPRCSRDVPCEDECTWYGDQFSSPGVPACHPTLCGPCRLIVEGYESDGSGI